MLAHCNNSLRIDIPPHSDTLYWFWTNQPLFLLLNAVLLNKEATNTNLIVYSTRGEHANPYTTDGVNSGYITLKITDLFIVSI